MKSCKVNIARFLITLAVVYLSSAFISGSLSPARFDDGVRQGAVFWLAFMYIVWFFVGKLSVNLKKIGN